VFIEQENLIVKRMGLFATEFVRADGTTLYYFNSNLFTKFMYVSSSLFHIDICTHFYLETTVQTSDEAEYVICFFCYTSTDVVTQKQFEGLTLQVDWRTPLSKLEQLETKMNEWLASDENRWYNPPTGVVLQHIDFQRCLELTMGIPHNGYVLSCAAIDTGFNLGVVHGKTGACAMHAKPPFTRPLNSTVDN
jgi:hypothetical protein